MLNQVVLSISSIALSSFGAIECLEKVSNTVKLVLILIYLHNVCHSITFLITIIITYT